MRYDRIRLMLPIIIIGLLLPGLVSGQYAVEQSVFGNGSSSGSNSTHQIDATVGQTNVGVTTGPNHENDVGFWFTVP